MLLRERKPQSSRVHRFRGSLPGSHLARRGRRTPLPAGDPREAAKAAGLQYFPDSQPGFRRQRAGRAFSYLGLDGQPIHAAEERRRIKALAIPPAWTDVWICPSPRGHLQATGRDARGRKQYRYHPRWRQVRDETKYERMYAFGEALPGIRERVGRDLARCDLPREQMLAAVVQLLETTLIRVGNEEYARANRSYGLTTLRHRHAEVSGSVVTFQFRGKSGKTHTVGLSDRRLARIVKRCQDLPGYELFQYLDAAGQLQRVGSADVNVYLREIAGQDFTAKDFRTWAGTVLAAQTLRELGPWGSAAHARKAIATAIQVVAARLGNTAAVSRKCYVHPVVIDAYLDGSLAVAAPPARDEAAAPTALSPDEEMVMNVLRRRHTAREAAAQLRTGTTG